MSQGNKGRGRPQPDAADPKPLLNQLRDALNIEYKFKTNPLLSIEPQEPGEVTVGCRDGAVNVLRCLKMWYDLPTDVFFVAINFMDHFLTKMKVRNRHMACISISSLYLAAKIFNRELNPDDLVTISQSKCTSSDMLRMANVISAKLFLNEENSVPVTAVHYIRIYCRLIAMVASQLGIGHLYAQIINEQDLCNLLEIVVSDSCCANERPSVLSLVFLHTRLEEFLAREIPNKSVYFSMEMFQLWALTIEFQNLCNIDGNDFVNCREKIITVLKAYNDESKLPHRQRLEWRVSSRTLRQLRPSSRLIRALPTIDEHVVNLTASCSKLII